MSRIAVVNQKGGVGKTTTVMTLSTLLALHKGQTLAVDLDPHGSLSGYFGIDPDSVIDGSYGLFSGKANAMSMTSSFQPSTVERLRVLPASTQLATVERSSAQKPGLGLALRNMVDAQRQYEHIVIDTPPTLGVLMVNALAACDVVVLPVQTDILAIKGLELVYRTLDRMESARGWHPRRIVVPTFYDRRTKASARGLEILRLTFPDALWSEVIPIDSSIRNASLEGIPYPLFRPRGKAYGSYVELMETILKMD